MPAPKLLFAVFLDVLVPTLLIRFHSLVFAYFFIERVVMNTSVYQPGAVFKQNELLSAWIHLALQLGHFL